MSKKPFNQLSSRRKFISLAGTGVVSLAMAPHIVIASGGKVFDPGN